MFRTYLDAVARTAADPVTGKYLGRLAAADVFTHDNAATLLESLRVDAGVLAPSAFGRDPLTAMRATAADRPPVRRPHRIPPSDFAALPPVAGHGHARIVSRPWQRCLRTSGCSARR
ncbi:hypothetical protein EDD90_9465 [Streptomyces sp. Ag109_O5-1]|uniref:hypothetical protein n=1 Tax=Streptomyces sp. Ag109_O5-1 TaxID=1938851 RepID=UPI000F91A68E|nr:hypothetical protein [Streptomyces sp. Ag109_O5-1]RPE46142.1 hypothetical protein EDD90_9465 [Streptomyces sp. Ag109_O5-1]